MIPLKVYLLLLVSLAEVVLNIGSVHAVFGPELYPPTEAANHLLHSVASKPLFLTPYIESNKLDEARNLSEVKNLGVDLKSYSGFLTVDKQYDSNMFFWFFPPLSGGPDSGDKPMNVPILLWLQGGPGSSSLFGLFVENGPLVIDVNSKPSLRNFSWNEDFALLYIDNPVGAGFSFTKNDSGYANNETEVAEDLYEALQQFFTLFHEYQSSPFFLTGESYAGKYVPAIAYKIHKEGKMAKMNLQGLAIGDGWCDPLNMLDYGQFLYHVGLIDELQQAQMIAQQNKIATAIKSERFDQAVILWDELLSFFTKATGLNFIYNYLYDVEPLDFSYYIFFLASPKVRESIHVGDTPYGQQSHVVYQHLQNEMMASVKPWIEELLDANYRTLFYSGQMDVIVASTLTENFLQKLEWKGAQNFTKTPKRTVWKVDAKDTPVAGYVHQADNLYLAILRNSGHMLPYDQPRAALDMIKRFVMQISFDDPHTDE